MKISRRELGAALVTASALAQTPAPGPLPSPEVELQAARDQVRALIATLQTIEVPMTTEPAFAFHA